VLAREEERRLMRRELHDGVGPALAGMSLGLQSLQRSATSDDQRALATELLEQARTSLAEVRVLARDLRPAALDELGLVAAVRQHAQATGRLSRGHPHVDVTIEDALPDLPAAVEVAAYRIVQEAITNVVRHADAGLCHVRIAANGSLLVRVEDNGTGVTPSAAGAGLRSMSERAEELGGACTVTFTPGRGTSVLAVLPLHEPEPVTHRDESDMTT
jgi:signal transduction histidine kinase